MRDRRFRQLRRLASIGRDERGIGFVEFALMLPLFAAFLISGLELSNVLLANMKVQRMATMAADLVAQKGASDAGISELQIADLFSALEMSAKPFNLRTQGRIAVSAVLGQDANADGVAEGNKIVWQRFDGDYVSAPLLLGCWIHDVPATLPGDRQMIASEALYHAQVSYDYEPIFGDSLLRLFNVPTTVTKVAVFRARGSTFQDVQTSVGFPAKSNCDTAGGL